MFSSAYGLACCEKKTRGFSLVELMVSLVVGLIVILGAGQLFITAKQTYNQMGELSIRQQSLRVVSDFVSLDIRTASEILGNGGDEGVLHLSYDSSVRLDDPYCSSASLSEVKYRFDSEERALMVSVACGGSLGPEEELVIGLDSVRFTPDPERGLEDGLFVWIDIEFPPMQQGEPVEKTQYRTIVARRGNILN